MVLDLKPLKDFLASNIIKDGSIPENDSPLFTNGLIDSFGMLDLLFFINEQYGVRIEDFEMVDRSVDSINDIKDLIISKL